MELNRVVNNLWNRSINSATSNAYLSGYKCLCKFIHSHFPATDMHYILCNITEDVFIYFVSHCYSVLKLKYSTIKFYLAGVCHFSLSIFNHNPLIDTYCCSLKRLENIMTGVKKSGDNLSNQKLPITYDVLCRLNYHFSSVIVNKHMDFTLMTTCIVAFFGFLRCGEFTCKQTFDPSSNLTVNDITTISSEQVTVRFKASKTDVFQKGVIIKLFKTDKTICPYKQLTRYIDYR